MEVLTWLSFMLKWVKQIGICKNEKDEEMRVQQLKYILKVAEVGSITEAAKLLFISQPSLSNSLKAGRNIMNIGNQILNIRKENQLTQEEFGKLFHVTRQTVSNWENGKSYSDLQILVSMSNQFSSHPVLFKIK